MLGQNSPHEEATMPMFASGRHANCTISAPDLWP